MKRWQKSCGEKECKMQTAPRKTHGQMLIYHLPQLIIEETEGLLEKWKHPDPYRAPTAPGGSKYERNLPVPSTERKFLASRLAKT